MTDIFGDQSPYDNYSNPLISAVEQSQPLENSIVIHEHVREEKRMSDLSKTLITWGVIIGAVVGTCVYVSQQHGPRPTLLPAETTIAEE